MKRKTLIIILIFILVINITACDSNTKIEKNNDTNDDKTNRAELTEDRFSTKYPFTFIDDSKTEVTITKAPMKVASAAPSNTEIIYALKKQNILYGVTEYCNYPSDALNKDKIGDYNGPNIEKVLELGIDILISDWIDDSVKKQLTDAGVIVVVIKPSTYSAVYDRIKQIAKILDAQKEADILINDMKQKTTNILERIKGQPSEKVFFESWHDPLSTAGPGSFIDEMINLCGGENVAHDAISSYAEFSSELVIQRDPDVYLTSDDGFKTIEDIRKRPGYSELSALKNNRVYFLNEDIISRPGPRLVDALELVAKAMYPKSFE